MHYIWFQLPMTSNLVIVAFWLSWKLCQWLGTAFTIIDSYTRLPYCLKHNKILLLLLYSHLYCFMHCYAYAFIVLQTIAMFYLLSFVLSFVFYFYCIFQSQTSLLFPITISSCYFSLQILSLVLVCISQVSIYLLLCSVEFCWQRLALM